MHPDRPPPAPPPGFTALAEPHQLRSALDRAGFVRIEIEEIEGVWEGPSGTAYLDEVRDLHPYVGAYADVDAEQRREIDGIVLSLIGDLSSGDRVRMSSPVVLATAERA